MTDLRTAFDQRRFFLCAVAPAAALALAGCAASGAEHDEGEGGEAEVTPGEDLMQEHGVVERLLLVYSESARRIEAGENLDVSIVSRTAVIVRRFVQDYHEKNEEMFVFPRLRKADRETDLVAVLLSQHERGRALTADIERMSSSRAPTPELARALRAFERMYRPHAAREDTVLFPAFRSTLDRDDYRELGEAFEDEEHKRFGEHGFESTVADVAKLEDALGIGDLASFTPR